MEQVTYGALKKPLARKEMLKQSAIRLGTQAGNYGVFTEEARILTLQGANEIKEELRALCEQEQLSFDSLLEFSPVLKGLIE